MSDLKTAADRIRRAIVALNKAPDVDPAKATRTEVAALHAANEAAWIILTEDAVPPSRRSADFERLVCHKPFSCRIGDEDV